MSGAGLRVPPDLVGDVRWMRDVFEQLAPGWVAAGHHSDAEILEFRARLREAFGSGPCSWDDRPQRERIRAWVPVFRNLLNHRNGGV